MCTRVARAVLLRGPSTSPLGNRVWVIVGIQRLCICDWSNSNRRDVVVLDPPWPQVEAAIRALNNRNLNDVYLTPLAAQSETFLGIGGGSGQYLLTGAVAGKTFPTLVTALNLDDSLVPLVVGGQLGEYPARWLVSLDDALSAARAFFDAGGFDCGVEWAYPRG